MSDKPGALPPIGIGDAKSFFGKSRQRIDVATSPSALLSRSSPANMSFRKPKPVHPPLASTGSHLGLSGPLSSVSAATSSGTGGVDQIVVGATESKRELLESLTLIPRDFFVIETNAVLPVARLAPQKCVSDFNGTTGLWETIVFPALEPTTRRQVLSLRDTLEKMLAQHKQTDPVKATSLTALDTSGTSNSPSTSEANPTNAGASAPPPPAVSVPVSSLSVSEAHDLIAYTQKEWKIYSICFSELIRQTKFLCKEQSQLFGEVRDHYDAAMKRLVGLIEQIENLNKTQSKQISALLVERDEKRKEYEQFLAEQATRAGNASSSPAAGEEEDNEMDPNYRCAMCAEREAAMAAGVDGSSEGGKAGRKRSILKNGPVRNDRNANDTIEEEGEEAEEEDDDDEQEEEDSEHSDSDDSHKGGSKDKELRDEELDEKITTARVEGAIHKFRLRQEQQRQIVDESPSNAACAIQKSFRGFLDRHKLIHRKAIEQIIASKRKQAAAVEVLQTTMRSYLNKIRNEREQTRRVTLHLEAATHRRKHGVIMSPAADYFMAPTTNAQSKELTELTSRFNELTMAFCALESEVVQLRNKGLSRSNTSVNMSSSIAATAAIAPSVSGTARHHSLLPSANLPPKPTSAPSPAVNDDDAVKQSFERARQHANAFEKAVLKLRVKMLKSLQTAALASSSPPGSSEAGTNQEASGLNGAEPTDHTSTCDNNASRPTSSSVSNGSRGSTPEAALKETAELFSASTQAIGLDHIALSELDDSMIDRIDLDILRRNQPSKVETLSRTTSTSDLAPFNDDNGMHDRQRDRHESFHKPGEHPFKPSLHRRHSYSHSFRADGRANGANGDSRDYDDEEDEDPKRNLSVFATHFEGTLHDDSVWHTAPAYVSPDADAAVNDESVRRTIKEKKKKLVWIKKLIGSMYDTLIKQLQEHRWVQSPSNAYSYQAPSCSLAMSYSEWKQHQYMERESSSSSSSDSAPSLSSSRSTIDKLVQQHEGLLDIQRILSDQFQRQFGLRRLVEQANDEFALAVEHFAREDPDIELFRCFFHSERSLEELEFYCYCRYVASRADYDVDVNGRNGNPLFPFSFHHPAADQFNQRDTIDLHHALCVARTLFRVEEEPRMLQEDAHFVETENPVYRKYLPSSCLDQFEQIIKRLFLPTNGPWLPHVPQAPDTGTSNVKTTRPQSPQVPALAAGGSEAHASPLHRRIADRAASAAPHAIPNQQEESCSVGVEGAKATAGNGTQWVCFTEFVDLLLKYRNEMHHFHYILKWAIELFERIEKAHCDRQASQNPEVVHRHFIPMDLFVEQLYSLSQGASARELGNIFLNALKQRNLQELMPLRIFVSIILLMLRSNVISVICYQPLSLDKIDNDQEESADDAGHNDLDDPTNNTNYHQARQRAMSHEAALRSRSSDARRDSQSPDKDMEGSSAGTRAVADPVVRDLTSGERSRPLTQEELTAVEKEWMVLARQWRSKEPEFEEAVESIYDTRRGDEPIALKLLKQRDHLFQLLSKRGTKQDLNKARDVYYDLVYQVNINLPISVLDRQKTPKATKFQRTNRAAIAGWW